ncbi:MAG: FAD-dependent oxidoreductase, partial [Pseudomonadota bacterium]
MHRRVERLPALPGPAAWNAILGDAPRRCSLSESRVADFVIIGAGFAGLSAARRLRQLDPKAQIVILEAGQVAEGTAGRNSGFMIDLPHDLASENYAGSGNDADVIALNRKAIAFAETAVAEYQINANYFDKAGKINGAASAAAEANNTSYARHLSALNEPSEALDAQSMKELTGSNYYRSGLYTSGTVMLQPAGYVRGLATGLERDGVEIFEHSPVTELRKERGDWRAKTPSGSISANKVILTVNGHLDSFGFAKRKLMQIFLYAVMTPELDAEALKKIGGRARWGVTPSDPMGTTIRKIDVGQGGNRIVVRTCATLA